MLDRPLVGGRLGFSVDAVVALQPDLVVVTPSRQAANQLIDPMERLGIPIVVLLQRNVAEILSNIRLMALIAGVPERGEAVVAGMERRMAAVRQRIEGRKLRLSIMITGRLAWLMLVAREGTCSDAIVRAGGRFGLEGTAAIAESRQAILSADPDMPCSPVRNGASRG